MIINELMIDSSAVQDKFGEWVEFYNTTSDWIDLRDSVLRDMGSDENIIQETSAESLIIPPNGYAVICAEANYWNNGGVDCQGTFLYQCFGGAFCLSNSEDEVILYTAGNLMLDRVMYSSGFAVEGASLGVTPQYANDLGNNNLDNWCEQWWFLPMGDSGSPGEENDYCQ